MGLPIERTHLDGVVMFLVVAELRSFRAAARQLGVTPSAVSQSVRALEERIGAPLFFRTTRSVGLTEAGERLLTRARPAVDLLTAGLDAASDLGAGASGRLRISAPRASLLLLANSLLPQFLELYPQIQLELIGDDGLIDIIEERYDAGIRLGHHVQPDMVSVWLTPPERYVVVAAPAFLERHGRPLQPPDLSSCRCIIFRQPSKLLDHWELQSGGQRVPIAVDGPLIANDVETCICATLRGVGLFQLPRSLVIRHLDRGDLETVLDDFAYEVPGLSLYFPSRSQSLPKLRAFIDFATKHMRRELQPYDYHV